MPGPVKTSRALITGVVLQGACSSRRQRQGAGQAQVTVRYGACMAGVAAHHACQCQNGALIPLQPFSD
jgi:hypothetical protein